VEKFVLTLGEGLPRCVENQRFVFGQLIGKTEPKFRQFNGPKRRKKRNELIRHLFA